MVTNNRINSRQPVVQFVYTSTSSVVNCSTQTPIDDTIPQNTEGNEVLTLSITPTNASNLLIIKFHGFWTAKDSLYGTVALFQDATANSLAAFRAGIVTGLYTPNACLKHTMVAGTTSSTTFKIRIGPSAAGNLYVNGTSAGARLYGGVASTNLTIMEIKA